MNAVPPKSTRAPAPKVSIFWLKRLSLMVSVPLTLEKPAAGHSVVIADGGLFETYSPGVIAEPPATKADIPCNGASNYVDGSAIIHEPSPLG